MMPAGGDYLTDCTPPIEAAIEFGISANKFYENGRLILQSGVELDGHVDTCHWVAEPLEEEEPAFGPSNFTFKSDVDGNGQGTHARVKLNAPIPIQVPMTGVVKGDSLLIQTGVIAWAEDRRQSESFAGAFFPDPVSPMGIQIESHSLRQIAPVPVPKHVLTPAPPRGSPTGTAGALQFSAPSSSPARAVSGEAGRA
jgi:hypothetical protein